MSDFQDLCKKLHPVIKGIGEGAYFMVSSDGITWVDADKAVSALSFLGSCEFKERPRTIKIGEFDVPEPMREDPRVGDTVYLASTLYVLVTSAHKWLGEDGDRILLSRGIVHSNAMDAQIHSEALIALTSAK